MTDTHGGAETTRGLKEKISEILDDTLSSKERAIDTLFKAIHG